MVAEIERRGGIPLLIPLLEIAPPLSWEPCDRALDRLDSYDAVIFTSRNAVAALTGRMDTRRGGGGALRSKRAFVIGEATGSAAREAGLRAEELPEKATAAALAARIASGGVKGRRFLFPCGDLARETLAAALSAAGAACDRVEVYRTVPADVPDVEATLRLLNGGHVDFVTFASPSAVRVFVRIFPDLPLSRLRTVCRIAVIGPTTASAVREAGAEPDVVARVSNVAGLIEAISTHGNP
jgi:uroporphyrinogen-III synthase